MELLAIGKRLGLTFNEMNLLRVKDLLALVKIYSGEQEETTKEATQADFDNF